MEDLTLEQLNLELAIAHLIDCERYWQECIDGLNKASEGIEELRERLIDEIK